MPLYFQLHYHTVSNLYRRIILCRCRPRIFTLIAFDPSIHIFWNLLCLVYNPELLLVVALVILNDVRDSIASMDILHRQIHLLPVKDVNEL